MTDDQWLAERFQDHRGHLHAVAYRMLGSLSEADDAVQETWMRASRAGTEEVENLGGWLTTIVARVSLNMLRSRRARQEDPFGVQVPDPIVTPEGALRPEDEAVLADSVGLALLVVLESLSPDERLAFVLHDMFRLPFADIAPMVGRSPAATRQLASRARRRVTEAEAPAAEPDLGRQRMMVSAFFQAAREGDFDALVDLLHPEVVLHADLGGRRPTEVIRGPEAVAGQAFRGAIPRAVIHPVLVNGTAGAVITVRGRPFAIMGFTIVDGRIAGIQAISDSERVRRIAAPVLGAD